jgi:hypothetical protein
MAGADRGGPATVVAQVPSEVEAQIIVGLLQSEGIPAAVTTDAAGGVEPQLELSQSVRVLVRGEDEERARALIAASQEGTGQ